MAASPAPKESPNETSARGRDAVRQRLLAAAADLLASAPPTEVTGREIAELAGVNHGQIHHYFGSKDGLVAATVEDSTARYHQDRLQGGLVFPLPIETSRRSPAWRTLAYLAMTGEWRRPPFEPSPVVASLAHRRGEDLGRKPSSPDVMAEGAATMALQRGWWIFQDIIEAGLAGYRPKLGKVRAEVARRSVRLIDDSIPVAKVSNKAASWFVLDTFPADAPAPRGREEVCERLLLAARHLLEDAPPTEVTSKEIAALAEVNHGQVHHYFESKEHLIANSLRMGSTAVLAALDAKPSVVPIRTEQRIPLWRTLAHLAATEEWSGEVYDHRSPVVARMVEIVADRKGQPTSSPDVQAQVAVVHALELGWAVYRDIIEHGLEPLGGDLDKMRRRLAAISGRLVDDEVRA